MGVDLKVMASHFRERRGELLPTAVLRFDRDDGLFSQLGTDSEPGLVSPLPDGLSVANHDDDGLRYVSADANGRPLTYTTSYELRRLRVPADTVPWNRAILAFLLTLPPDTRIVLFWC